MKYSECQIIKNSSMDLIGKPIGNKGFIPDDIWIIPKDEKLIQDYLMNFKTTEDVSYCESLFPDDDLQVVAVDSNMFMKSGVLLYHLIKG